MVCPHCGTTTSAAAGRCASCNGILDPKTPPQVAAGLLTPVPSPPSDSEEVTRLAAEAGIFLTPPPLSHVNAAPGSTRIPGMHAAGMTMPGIGSADLPLAPGQAFGTRYHVIRLLGVGGMGAVYQAWDTELGVAVAIKIVRPEVAADPAQSAELQRRFKRELLLARQVTHRNVVRIHDLGEIDGIKYITMPFIQGQDLATLLRNVGRLPVSGALTLAKQIVAGLQAAHEAGVVHRDLKPANIMVEEEHAVIMDFGIARAAGGGGSTVLGTVVGTLEYMAPEQARGEAVDHRADLYAFGLIVYDMLVGRRHVGSDSILAELMARMQHLPKSMREVDPHIPEPVDQIVMKCVQPNPADRYQTAAELCADLDALDAQGQTIVGRTLTGAPAVAPPRPRQWWKAAAAIALVAAVGAGGYFFRDRIGGRSAGPVLTQQVSLAIVPFRNATDDKTLDWVGTSVAEMLRTEIGESSLLNVVTPGRVQGILSDLQISRDANLDPATLGRLAEYSKADTIVWGQYVKYGSGIQLTGTLEDVKGHRSVELRASAVNEAALLGMVADLAGKVREALALSSNVVQELQKTSAPPSTKSVEALRRYHDGLALVRKGSHAAAVKEFQASIAADSNFALAHAQLAEAYRALNAGDEAQRSSETATNLSRNLPEREQYVIRATAARVKGDTKGALDAYQNLLKVSPNDQDTLLILANLYESTGDYQNASAHVDKVLQTDPNNVDALILAGRIEIRRRQWQRAMDRLNPALNLAIRSGNDEAKANALHSIGVVYRRQAKPKDALQTYQQALEIKQRIGQKGSIATTLNEIGHVQVQLGRSDEAIKSYTEALNLRREVGDRRGIGSSLIDIGVFHADRSRYDEALKYYKEALQIQRELGNIDYEALCLNNIGSVYLFKGQYDDAVTYLRLSLGLREKLNDVGGSAVTLHSLGEAYAKMGQFVESQDHYLRSLELYRKAQESRSAAMEQHYLATVFEYQGRYGAAVKSREEALKALSDLKDRSIYLAGVTSGYGRALNQMGRFDEGSKQLDEALALARQLKHDALTARTLNYQGEGALYRGDVKAARALFDQALPIAEKTKNSELIVLTKLNEAKASLAERKPQQAAATLRGLAAEAEAGGLQYIGAEASIALGQALIEMRQVPQGTAELQRVLARCEKLGMQPLAAQGHALLAQALRASDAPAASKHASDARRILDAMKKEAVGGDPLKRADLRDIYASVSQ